MCLCLYGMNRFLLNWTKNSKEKKADKRFKTVDYVVHVTFWQGTFCPNRKIAMRILAGTWCLAGFVFFTAYSSVLISYIVVPNLKPVIDSVEELPKVPGLKMVVEKGATMEMMFLVQEFIIFKIRFRSFTFNYLNVSMFKMEFSNTLVISCEQTPPSVATRLKIVSTAFVQATGCIRM